MMKKMNLQTRQRGQGMTEYIIIVALIAIAAVGVYQGFGGVVRGQTASAAGTLAGTSFAEARTLTTTSNDAAKADSKVKTLATFEK